MDHVRQFEKKCVVSKYLAFVLCNGANEEENSRVKALIIEKKIKELKFFDSYITRPTPLSRVQDINNLERLKMTQNLKRH